MTPTPTLARSLGYVALAASALWLASCAVPSPSADGALARATQAMGTDRVTTLRYTAEGTGYTFGQAYKPGGAWPKITCIRSRAASTTTPARCATRSCSAAPNRSAAAVIRCRASSATTST